VTVLRNGQVPPVAARCLPTQYDLQQPGAPRHPPILKEDADVTAAALELTQAKTQLQASFAMRAKMPQTSLFNYLA